MLTKRQFILTSSALLAGLAAGPAAYAHRLKKATTRLVWQAGDQSLEITHILHLHDAEQALSDRGLLKKPDLTPLKARAQLALYVQDKFRVFDLNHQAIPLETIGAEIQSGHIYVYQEANLPKAPDGLVIDNAILLDVFGTQVNMVNVDLSGAIKTLQFTQGDKPKKVLA